MDRTRETDAISLLPSDIACRHPATKTSQRDPAISVDRTGDILPEISK